MLISYLCLLITTICFWTMEKSRIALFMSVFIYFTICVLAFSLTTIACNSTYMFSCYFSLYLFVFLLLCSFKIQCNNFKLTVVVNGNKLFLFKLIWFIIGSNNKLQIKFFQVNFQCQGNRHFRAILWFDVQLVLQNFNAYFRLAFLLDKDKETFHL